VVDELVDAAVACGARLAEPGEFTRRAFTNGKLDLVQAEAVADLIESHSRAARRAALEQLRGRLSERLRATRQAILNILGDIEASIDFVEEGIEFFNHDQVVQSIAAARQHLDALIATADDGLMLRSGVRVCLAGAPNVGKSSLFNRILRSPRSIVTSHPGTTRDVVSETIRIGGLAVVLEDTAGLRADASDPVEVLGIERSRQSHAEADVIVFVLDASRPLDSHERQALEALDRSRAVVVLNKVDLSPAGAGNASVRDALPVSALTGEGVDAVLDALLQSARLRRLALQNATLVTINQRHRGALQAALESLRRFETDIETSEPPEILAADLRQAVVVLGEVSGENVTEEILDSIFSRFCIGK
jgi:tRNA modification GTPase